MLQVKIWSFNLHKPNGYTAKKMEKEINRFMKAHTCIEDSFELQEVGTGILIAKVVYKIRKTNK